MKKGLKNILPYLVSAVLLFVFFRQIDYQHIWESVRGADVDYLLAALGVYFVSTSFILWRWIVIMKTLNLKFFRFNAARWFFLGLMFSFMLPSSVGGDFFRGMGLGGEVGNKTKVFASIVLDRLIGFVSIVLLASIAFFFGRKIVNNHAIGIFIACMFVGLMSLGVVFFSKRIFTKVTSVFKVWPKVRDVLMNLHHDMLLMKGRYQEVALTIVISMASQIVFAFEFYLIAKALHQNIPFVYFLVFSPLVCVVSSLPSIGGLGVREIGWVTFLSILGIPEGVSGGLSLISFVLMVIVGLLGGLFYVTTVSFRRVQHHQADARLKPGNA